MGISKFRINCKESDYTIKESKSLKSIYEHLVFYIDKAENYIVYEMMDDDTIESCNGDFLIKNFNSPDQLPISLLDI